MQLWARTCELALVQLPVFLYMLLIFIKERVEVKIQQQKKKKHNNWQIKNVVERTVVGKRKPKNRQMHAISIGRKTLSPVESLILMRGQ